MGMAVDPAGMYQELILQHYRAPHGRGVPAHATGTAERRNPLCGDQLRVGVVVRDGIIQSVGFDGRSCSIATASASMMTDALRGVSVRAGHDMIERVEQVLRGEKSAMFDESSDLRALTAVADYPQRVGCARMPWLALREALASSHDEVSD